MLLRCSPIPQRHATEALAHKDVSMSDELRSKLGEWVTVWQNTDACNAIAKDVMRLVTAEKGKHAALEVLDHEKVRTGGGLWFNERASGPWAATAPIASSLC